MIHFNILDYKLCLLSYFIYDFNFKVEVLTFKVKLQQIFL